MTWFRGRACAITAGLALALGIAVLIPGNAHAAGCGGYVVQQGDTLSRLAQQHNTNAAVLASTNHIADPNRIFVGQCLTLSGGAPNVGVTAAANNPAIVATAAPTNDTRGILTQAAYDHSVDPALVRAIAWHESNWNQGARGSSGEIGMMQILPTTAYGLNANHGTNYDVYSAWGNAQLGAMFLRELLNQNGNCLACAISAYNQGQGNFQARGYQNWNSYVGPVLGLMSSR